MLMVLAEESIDSRQQMKAKDFRTTLSCGQLAHAYNTAQKSDPQQGTCLDAACAATNVCKERNAVQ
jgi:hypothetical protein